jgi:hypothetical protein
MSLFHVVDAAFDRMSNTKSHETPIALQTVEHLVPNTSLIRQFRSKKKKTNSKPKRATWRTEALTGQAPTGGHFQRSAYVVLHNTTVFSKVAVTCPRYQFN